MVVWLDLSVGRGGSFADWGIVVRTEQPAGCLYNISYEGWGWARGAGLGLQWVITDPSGAVVLVCSLLAVLVSEFR